MTTLETKIFDFIEKQYEAKFLGKVKVDINFKEKIVFENIPTEVTSFTKSINYGRLYNWYAANDPRGIAPIGWHLPSKEEYQTLIDFTCGISNPLSWKSTALRDTSWGGINSYNFNAIGAGIGYPSDNYFFSMDYSSIFLTTSTQVIEEEKINLNKSYSLLMGNYDSLGRSLAWTTIEKSAGVASIRLIKDNSIDDGDIIIDGDIYNTIKIGEQVWLQQNLATRHYQNGDLIGTNFINNIGAVCSYGNEEAYVYNYTPIIKIVDILTPIITLIPIEYCVLITLNNYMIPLSICIGTDNEDEFYSFICKEIKQRNFPIVSYLKLTKTENTKDE